MGSKHAGRGKTKGLTKAQEIENLRRKIKLAKTLPDNFRDIPLGTKAWSLFIEMAPERREEIETWAAGRILVFQPINKLEAKILGDRVLRIYPEDTTFDWELFKQLVDKAEKENCSFIYLQDQTIPAINHLNYWLSIWGTNCRIRPAYVDDKGRRIGDVY